MRVTMMAGTPPGFDLFVIGGGINGCGIARDAAGRGLSVGLAEMNDLASGTSSASTKLIHGGLRYLEYFEFRLVRESLREREVLLRMSPHIARPMRFVLPCRNDMRFAGGTPAAAAAGRCHAVDAPTSAGLDDPVGTVPLRSPRRPQNPACHQDARPDPGPRRCSAQGGFQESL